LEQLPVNVRLEIEGERAAVIEPKVQTELYERPLDVSGCNPKLKRN
jgi:hypothetical protein